MAAVKWKEPFFISIPVISLLILILLPSQSQWITWRNGRNSNLWHPNMPAPRTLRHSQSSSSNSRSGNRPLEHRSVNNNYYTIHSHKDQHGSSSSSSSNGAYHQNQQQQARYSSADYGRRDGASSSQKNVRISDIPARTSPSSPTSAPYQRSMSYQQRDREQNTFSHRHLPMNQKGKNWQNQNQSPSSSSKHSRSGIDITKRPVSQQAGHLLDSWPNTNTHHHLAPVPTGASKQNAKSGFSNLKPEQWGNNVLVSNKPIELSKPKMGKRVDDKKATDRQLVLPSGYPKDKAVTNTINTLTKLSPKKPIFVFMRKEGVMAVKAGADAGDVIKKLAGTSKLPFYNGTSALPSHSMPTVFLAPEDMGPPAGYGKIPIPNLKPKNATPKPTYSKILMPGGTHMKGPLVTTTTSTTPGPTTASTMLPQASATGFEGFDQLFNNNSMNSMSLEQKLQLLQLLRSQPNNPLADQAALAILAGASPSPFSPSPSAPVPSAIAPQGQGQIFQGPTLALPTQGYPNAQNQWPPQQFPGPTPGLFGSPSSPIPGIIGSSTISPLPGVPSSVSPSQEPGSEQDIHKLIGTIVESAVSNTVTSMLQHQNHLQQSLIGVGPPLHANQLPGAPGRGPPPFNFGRGPPPPQRPPQGPPRFPPFQQRPPFPPTAGPGRFPHPSAQPPQPQPYPTGAPPPGFPPNPTGVPQQQFQPNPTGNPPQPSPNPTAAPTYQQPQQNPTGAPPPPPFQFQYQQPQQPQQFQQRPGPIQHPYVPQFQSPPGYPNSTPQPFAQPSHVAPQVIPFNPSSTAAPPQYQQQPQYPYPNPNGGRPPAMRMVERPMFGNKPRNPLQNALQFFGISTPRPDLAKSPTPSPTAAIMSSTPYPRPQPTPTPFGRPGPPQFGFPSSTPLPQRFPPTAFPQQQQQQQIQYQQQVNPGMSQQVQFQQQQQQQQPSQQIQVGLQPGDGNGKKPTLIVQTPNGTGKKNTYVITGGGQELPELNKIMKVLNDLQVDKENVTPQSPSPSSTTPMPIFSSTPALFTGSRSPTPAFANNRPTISPNVMIKNANFGMSPSPSPGVSASTQFISSTTPSPHPSSRPAIMSSTQLPQLSNVSPVMQIIQQIQAQIPGVQVSPSVQTVAQRQQSGRPSPRPFVSSTPSMRPAFTASPSPSSINPIMFSTPRPVSHSPSPTPGPVIISSTGFPRVINVSPSGSDTPASIHQAVVEAIMKQQAADAGARPTGQIQNRRPSPTPSFIEVIPAGGQIPGLGGNSNSKPFVVQLQQPTSAAPSSTTEDDAHRHLPFDINDPNIHIQQGRLESHETYTDKLRPESDERPRPVYSRERFQGKTHHHSKEVNDDYPEKNVRPSHRHSKEQYDDEDQEQLNPNRRMFSGENSKQDVISEEAQAKAKSEQEKLIEKIITEDRIVWKQGPNQGELIPTKVRTEERLILRPGDDAFSQRRTPLSSAEHLVNLAKQNGVSLEQDKSGSGSISRESPHGTFAGILRSKMKFEKMMEKLYPTKQIVSPFTISNNSANFVQYGEIAPTIASSLITTPQQQQFFMSSGPTLPSLIGSTLSGLVSPTPTGGDPGRYRIRPGDISHQEPMGVQMIGVSPSGQPIYIQSSPASPTGESSYPSPSSPPSSSSTSEQRLVFIPQGTAATQINKSGKPQILITTVDELPDLMAQLGGTNPEIRMVPDKATLEAELAKVAATSTISDLTVKTSQPTQATQPSSPEPSVQSTLFQASPTPTGMRRMDAPEKAFTWRPAPNVTAAAPVSTTPYDTSRRLVSGLGAGMLHAMSAGFGNLGNGVVNKYPWLGPSALPPLQQPQPTQLVYQMQNSMPMQKLNLPPTYQQIYIQPTPEQKAPLGYFSYKWANMAEQQPSSAPPTAAAPVVPSTRTPDYKLMYRSQYKEEELPISPDKLQPVSPVHKLKKSGKIKAKSRTTSSPIDPLSVEEYEDDDEDADVDLIPNDKHAGRNRQKYRDDQDESSEDEEEDNTRRRQDTRRNKQRRRRPGKLTDDAEEDEEVKRKRPTKPYDEEDDASPSPRAKAGQNNRGRMDIESDEEDEEEDYVYVKPASNVRRKIKVQQTTTTPKLVGRNKAIFVNREMFLVSGEERGKDPRAEPVYQPNQHKFAVLQGPSIISGQSVVKKSGSNGEAGEIKPSTTAMPKPTMVSPTTTTILTTTTSKATTRVPTTKKATTVAAKVKKNEGDDYKDAQDELRTLLKKIQDRLSQDEMYDFSEDSLYDYYDEMQQVLSTKATITTKGTTKGTIKPKKNKKGKNKKNKNKKKSKKNKKNKTLKSKANAIIQPIPTRPVTTTTTAAPTTPTYVHHHQRHPISSLEQFNSFDEKKETTTEAVTTTTTTTAAPVQSVESTEAAARQDVNSQSIEQAQVAYVFSQTAKDNLPKRKRRPLWVRRRIAGSGEGLQLHPMRMPNGPNGKVIRLVRRRRPLAARRRFMQQRQLQQQNQQSVEQQQSSTTSTEATSTTQGSIEIAPPNFSSPPLEQYFEQNSLERRVGNGESNEANGTVTLRSPKRKLKLIRLKGQRAQWRLRLQGAPDESSEGGPRPSPLIAPREVSAPLPLQAPLPAPVFTRKTQPSSNLIDSMRAAKGANEVKHYATSYSSESASSSVEAKVCIRGKCQVVSRQ